MRTSDFCKTEEQKTYTRRNKRDLQKPQKKNRGHKILKCHDTETYQIKVSNSTCASDKVRSLTIEE